MEWGGGEEGGHKEKRNQIIEITSSNMADGDVSNTHTSSIPVNIALKINQNATFFNTLLEIILVKNLHLF